jgi:lipid II:glycine glycyltransferase (peptidoglycan interpeptide bridge formation enzyme)
MATWRLLTNEEARKSWDEALLKFADHSPFQSYSWGEYRRSLGWEPYRWAAFNDKGEIVAMMSGVLRRYPFKVGMIWSEGGPVGDLSLCDGQLQTAIKESTGLKHLYCRFRCDRERDIHDALQLTWTGWSRSWYNLTSNFSMMVELKKTEEEALSQLNRDWKRNLKTAKAANLTVRQWLDPDPDEVLAVYTSMQTVKGLVAEHSHDEMAELLKNCRQHLIMYRCDDASGELVSLAGWLVFGDRASAFVSATSERGRKLSASYATFWELYQHCGRLGIESCDLAGIDPIKNHGVYHFKKGTGARPLEYLGEWDWATSGLLRWGGNWGISRRRWLTSTMQEVARVGKTVLSTLTLTRGAFAKATQAKVNVAIKPGAIATSSLVALLQAVQG